MAASSVDSVNQLTTWREHLDAVIADDPDAVVASDDQLAIENAIALGVAALASEAAPAESTEPPTRSILARDLRMTTDLVLRALQSHTG